MLCAAFQLQQMCFHHLGHRQRLVTMSYTFISFAQNSGSLFLPLTSQPPGDGFFPPLLCFVNTLPYIKQHTISFNQFSQFVINEPDKKLPYQKRPGYLSWDFSAVPFCFNEHFLLSAGQVLLPPAFVRCIQRWGLILLNSVSNNCTSIPPCAFQLNNFLNFLCTPLSLDMNLTVLILIIPFILCF